MGLDRMYWDDSMIVKAMDEAMLKYKVLYPSISTHLLILFSKYQKSAVLIRQSWFVLSFFELFDLWVTSDQMLPFFR